MNRKHTKGWMKHGDFIILDILLLQACFVFTYWIFHGISSPYANDNFQYLAILMFMGQVVVILFSSHYRSIIRRKAIDEIIAIAIYSLEIMAVTLVFLFMVKRSSQFSRLQVFVTTGMFWLVDFCVKQLNKKRVLRALKRDSNQKRLVLVTSRKYVEEAIQKLDQNISKNIRIVAVVLMDFTDPLRELGKTGKTSGLYVETDQNVFLGLSQDCEIMPLSQDALEWISHEWVDGVFVLQPVDQAFPQALMDGLIKMGITMYYSMSALDDPRWPVTDIQKLGGYKVLTSSVKFISAGWLVLKRLVDIIGGFVGCVFTLLLTIIIGPMIYFISLALSLSAIFICEGIYHFPFFSGPYAVETIVSIIFFGLVGLFTCYRTYRVMMKEKQAHCQKL